MNKIRKWLENKKINLLDFQNEVDALYQQDYSGLINAPTGSGKTLAILLPILKKYSTPQNAQRTTHNLKLLWLTPLKALTSDMEKNIKRTIEEIELDLTVESRTSDTSAHIKARQRKKLPDILVTTPESLHLLMSYPEYENNFKSLDTIVVDEWHELLGNKRGIQVELAVSRLKNIVENKLKLWVISATIGNLDKAFSAALFDQSYFNKTQIVQAKFFKNILIETIAPTEILELPWAGHLGIRLLPELYKLIQNYKTTIVFINTRSHAETWYFEFLKKYPKFADVVDIYHSSIDKALRKNTEENLKRGNLKLVFSTASLDLGVDLSSVEAIVQVGSPKSIGRFIQRAGRSGHSPDLFSKIYFFPTNAFEMLEISALKAAVKESYIENVETIDKPYDVLIQYLITLAISTGFNTAQIYKEVLKTNSYQNLTKQEWQNIIDFIQTGGNALKGYDRFKKVVQKDGELIVEDNQLKQLHRLNMGTIPSTTQLSLKMMKGKSLGKIDEAFLSNINKGDVFWFGGQSLLFMGTQNMTAYVKKASTVNGVIPVWDGGLMPFSRNLGEKIREKLQKYNQNEVSDSELKQISVILDIQAKYSKIPNESETLIEYFKTREGFHLVFYTFEGKTINKTIALLIANKIAQNSSITFTTSATDYGFELLSNQEINIEDLLNRTFYESISLDESTLNLNELAKRKFRDIARIAGLIIENYPGQNLNVRHLQSSSGLIWDVLKEYDSENLLLQQSFTEAKNSELNLLRAIQVINKIKESNIAIQHPRKPTPFSLPIIANRWKEKVTSEKLADRIKKMQLVMIK